MKNAYTSILLLTVTGFAVLVAGAVYFGAPLFGWIIMAAIFGVFLVGQISALAKLKQITLENSVINNCLSQKTFEVNGDGIVASRIKQARHLLENGIRLDSPIAYEVLSANSCVKVQNSTSGTVILLGLMGTFFGLMYSVATAGSVMDNASTQGTLDTIQVLFLNMKGIFGTSLCGLFAALILNATRGVLINERNVFMSRLDSLTLDIQGESAGEVEKQKTDFERLFSAVEKNLTQVTASVQTGLLAIVDKVCIQLVEAYSPMEASIKTLSTSVESIPSKIDDKLGAISGTLEKGLGNIANGVKDGLDGVTSVASKNIAASVADQVKQSNEQWNSFMTRLTNQTEANMESQQKGLDALKNVAVQVAEKAQAGSLELSQAVSEKLSNLSNEILQAFQKLSDSSKVLLDAQKTLIESIDGRVVKEKEATDALGGNIVETAELMRVNQSELSANLEMLRASLETILEKISGDTAEREEDNFVEHLNQSLESFHERASEVLMENAVKTQEILMEVLEQMQRVQASAVQQPKAEG